MVYVDCQTTSDYLRNGETTMFSHQIDSFTICGHICYFCFELYTIPINTVNRYITPSSG